MSIQNWPLILNLAIALFAVLPLIYVIWFYKKIKPSHTKVLIFGIALIGWSIIILAWLLSGLTGMEQTVVETSQEQKLKDEVLFSFKIWVFVFPAVTLAIGANLLTHYILTDENT